MAGGKSILLFIVFLNIFANVFAFGCGGSAVAACMAFTGGANAESSVLATMFLVGDDLGNAGEVQFSEQLENEQIALTTPEAGTASGDTPATFIDVAKMTLGIFALFTPAPIIAFFVAISLPGWIVLLIAAPLALLYVLALIEFWKGGSF